MPQQLKSYLCQRFNLSMSFLRQVKKRVIIEQWGEFGVVG